MTALTRKRTGLALALAMLFPLLVTPATAQAEFQIFFLAVGNSYYIRPRSSVLHGFGELPGANSSARVVADILARNGAVAGITLTSDEGRYVGKTDVEGALTELIRGMQAARAANPFLVVYFAGHGISEGVAWNHFSVPGNFVYGAPLDRPDIEKLALHAIHATSLSGEIAKAGVPYLLLLDTCYAGDAASFTSPVLSAEATRDLEGVASVLRHMNEFHTPDPVIFSAEPGRKVPLAPDPRNPERASLGPIGRRLLLLSSGVAASGSSMRLSSVVEQLTSPSLDSATSPPVTHATPPGVDGVLLGPSTRTARVEKRTGTATTQDVCCERGGITGTEPSGSAAAHLAGTRQTDPRRLRGSLLLQGRADDYISGGAKVRLPPGTPISVVEPDPWSLELTFTTHDGWELGLAAPEGGQLAPGTYSGAVRHPFQPNGKPGLSLSGAGRGCNEVSGSFVVTKLRRDSTGQLEEFVATFTQYCDGERQPLKGVVTVGK